MKTEVLKTNIDSNIKYQADKILSDIGITSSDAISILFKQIALQRSFPIELCIPNKITIDAMNDKNLEQISDISA